MKVFRSGMETWFSEGVVQWEGVIPPPNDVIGHTTFKAFINQQDIGWDQAIGGGISVNWGKKNALYCQARRLHSDLNIDDHWTTQLISDLWDLSGNGLPAPSFCTEPQRMNRLIFLAKRQTSS
jgi:hypothetical protein